MVILAAGLTPAWQQILAFETLRLGEVNRAQETLSCASGKVLNVACAAHSLGASVQTLSPVGGFTGEQIRREFAQLGIAAEWIPTEAPTRVCTTLLDRATTCTTEIVENSLPLSAGELQVFRERFCELDARANIVVFSGSLPQGVPSDFIAQLLERVSSKVLLDLRGQELWSALARRPWLVKPNREELEKTVHRPLHTDQDVVAAIRELQQAGAQRVIITQGGERLYAADAEGVWLWRPGRVEVVNPIGCGDSFAAGLAVGAFEGLSWDDTVRLAMASAMEAATMLVPARPGRVAVNARLAAIEPPVRLA